MDEKEWERVKEIVHEVKTRVRDWKDSFDSEIWNSLPLELRDETAKFLADLESWIEEVSA